MKFMRIKSFKIIMFFALLICSAINVNASPNTIRVTINISDSSNNQKTNRIVFSEGLGYTTGLDRGYDAGAYGGEAPGTGFQDRFGNSLAIYTLLVNDDLGTELGYTIQSLPYSKINNMVIPVGINPSDDDTITITATITDFLGDTASFPVDHHLILEDKMLNTFTELQESGSKYVVTLTQDEPELGRFYLHTTTETSQSLQAKYTQKTKSKKSRSTRIYGCKDKKAKNYNRFSLHKPSKCKYEDFAIKIDDTSKLLSIKEISKIEKNTSCKLNYTRPLIRGMRGDDVSRAQACFTVQNYEVGPEDGIFGPLTYQGVISYQTKNGLLIDGIIGPQTANHLLANHSLNM